MLGWEQKDRAAGEATVGHSHTHVIIIQTHKENQRQAASNPSKWEQGFFCGFRRGQEPGRITTVTIHGEGGRKRLCVWEFPLGQTCTAEGQSEAVTMKTGGGAGWVPEL